MKIKSIKKLQEKKMKTLGDKKECIAVFGNQFLVYPEKDVKECFKEILDSIVFLESPVGKKNFDDRNFTNGFENAKLSIIKIIEQKSGVKI